MLRVKLFSTRDSVIQKEATMISRAVWHMDSKDMFEGICMISVIFHKKIEMIKPEVSNKSPFCMYK